MFLYWLKVQQPSDSFSRLSVTLIAVFGVELFTLVNSLYALIGCVVIVDYFFRIRFHYVCAFNLILCRDLFVFEELTIWYKIVFEMCWLVTWKFSLTKNPTKNNTCIRLFRLFFISVYSIELYIKKLMARLSCFIQS